MVLKLLSFAEFAKIILMIKFACYGAKSQFMKKSKPYTCLHQNPLPPCFQLLLPSEIVSFEIFIFVDMGSICYAYQFPVFVFLNALCLWKAIKYLSIT